MPDERRTPLHDRHSGKPADLPVWSFRRQSTGSPLALIECSIEEYRPLPFQAEAFLVADVTHGGRGRGQDVAVGKTWE